MAREVDRLRAEAQRIRKNAGRKMARLARNHDVYVSGTTFDPRRPEGVEKKYNTRQLRNYIAELSGFVDRKTQFVPDSQRRPIPSEDWRAYKKLEKERNAFFNRRFEKYADFQVLPEETVRQRMAKMTPDHPQMADPAVNSPYRPSERVSTNVASRAALEKFMDQMTKQLDPEYFDEHAAKGMTEAKQMLEVINEPRIAGMLDDLSPDQFELLWNYTPFATALSLNYENMLKLLSDKEVPWQSEVARTALRDAEAAIERVKSFEIER